MVLWFFCHCLDGLIIRPVFLTSCQWWHWCSAAWTLWCQSQTTRTDLQLRNPEPGILRPQPEGPGLQWGGTGRWMSPGVPHDPGLRSEDLHHQRDGSPVNFSAALDTAENIRDKSFLDDEDEEGSSRKVPSAQYCRHVFTSIYTPFNHTAWDGIFQDRNRVTTGLHHVRSRTPDGFVYKIAHKGNLVTH